MAISRPAVLDPCVLTLDGIPLHPLVIHAVVVLLPLAALGAILVAARPVWRRTYGIPVLLLAVVGVGSVPVATLTGEQLRNSLRPTPAIALHEGRATTLLPYAIAFLVLLAVAVIQGIRDDRTAAGSGGAAVATSSRIVTGAAVLAALAGIVVTGLVIWIGHSGASAVWT